MNYEVIVFTCLTLSSMIGAGVLVVPNAVLPFGFAGTVGWVAASICSFVLARMFVEIILSQKTEASSGIPGIVKSEYSAQQAFSVGFGQWLFICFGCSAVALVFAKAFADLIGLSVPLFEFLLCIGAIGSLTVLYYFSTAALGILSLLTIVKVILFSTTSILGITEFNFINFFGINKELPSDGNGMIATIKYAFTHVNGEPVSATKFLSYVFKSCSAALFAFAGMEAAASSSSSVKDPKNTIPKATVIAVIACSLIFILTHICVINALGDGKGPIPEAPVKTAVEILTKRHFGSALSSVMGNLFSILAMIGCFGSVMTFCFTAPNCLYDTISIAYPDLKRRFPKSKSGFSIEAGIVSALVMSLIIFFYYFVNNNVSVILDYSVSLLISAYMKCALVHLKRRHNLSLSFAALFVCFFYMSGCSLAAIVFGLVVSHIGNIIFLLLSREELGNQLESGTPDGNSEECRRATEEEEHLAD